MIGLLLDVAAHGLSWEATPREAGHLFTLGGMLLALAGVARLAFRRPTTHGPDGRRD